jgi:multiple sugar transport system permease protein
MASDNYLQQYEKSEVRSAWIFIAPLLLVVGIFVLLPVIGTFYTSMFLDVSYLPRQFIGLRNYSELLTSPDFQQALRFTLAYTVAAVTLEAFFGVIFALLLNEAFPGRGTLRVVILIPWAIPTIISARTWQLIYEYTYGVMNYLVVNSGLAADRINWMGSEFGAFWALVFADVWKTTPFVVLILLAGLQAIPEDIYRQARVDGAGLFRRFHKITLPLLMPVLMISLIFRTIDSLRMFDLVYVLTGGGPGGSTRTLSYLGFEAFANDNFGMGSTVSVVTFIVAFAITIVYLRVGKFSEQLK